MLLVLQRILAMRMPWAATSTAAECRRKKCSRVRGFRTPRFEEYVGGSLGRAPKNPNLNFKALSRQNLAR